MFFLGSFGKHFLGQKFLRPRRHRPIWRRACARASSEENPPTTKNYAILVLIHQFSSCSSPPAPFPPLPVPPPAPAPPPSPPPPPPGLLLLLLLLPCAAAPPRGQDVSTSARVEHALQTPGLTFPATPGAHLPRFLHILFVGYLPPLLDPPFEHHLVFR